MKNPFSSDYDDKTDLDLINAAVAGAMAALESLILRHQNYIYNVALKMVGNSYDAKDITQEVLIKVITKLGQFKNESNFRTWLYRITFNHFLETKKSQKEPLTVSFDDLGKQLDSIKNEDLSDIEMYELKVEIEETKLTCMSGMLLCLEKEQRLVYILGEIFSVDHTTGPEMLDISKDNFRQKLSRARKDLYSFMNNKCGLIKKAIPCRCERKTKSFIKLGWVDKEQLMFNTSDLRTIYKVAPQKSNDLLDIIDTEYSALFKSHPFQEKDHIKSLFTNLLLEDRITDLFNLE